MWLVNECSAFDISSIQIAVAKIVRYGLHVAKRY